MKNKVKLMLSLMVTMVFMAIGTVAIYAAGLLNEVNSYSPVKVKVIWNTETMPEDCSKVEVVLDRSLEDQSYGSEGIPVRDTGKDGWQCKSGMERTLAYELDANDEPVFHPYDLKFLTIRQAGDVGQYTDLADRYIMTPKIETEPLSRRFFIRGEYYDTTVYRYNVEVTVEDKFKNITGELIWDNVAEADRPLKAEVKLVSNGDEIACQEVNKDGDWKYNLQVPKELENYEIVLEIPGYKAVQDGNNLIISKNEGKWKFEDQGWKYSYDDGSHVVGWKVIDGVWYYFNGSGYMQTGWLNLGGAWSYLQPSGAMTTGWSFIDGVWYYFNESGYMQTGWLNLGETRSYLQPSGAMTTGWSFIDGVWYYFNGSGYMQTGWLNLGETRSYLQPSGVMTTGWSLIDGVWYYFNGSGYMQTGWLNLGGAWYYLQPGGAMTTGWSFIDGVWYYFNESGYMATGWLNLEGIWYYLQPGGAMTTGWSFINGAWYYFNGSGYMQTGWQWINGSCYYFFENGVMAANQWIGNSWVNASGAWVA